MGMNDTEYLYDGTFEGLLTAFDEALRAGSASATFQQDGAEAVPSLFGSFTTRTDGNRAAALLARLVEAGGRGAGVNVLYGVLSEQTGVLSSLFQYVRLTLEAQRNIDGWHSRDAIRRVTQCAAKVGREIHRFQGLLRFRHLRDGTYYAPYEPDHNITVPLARHFTRRLRDQKWVIHDRRRNTAVLWDGNALQQVDFSEGQPDNELSIAEDEAFYQTQWKEFTRTISIESRRNPALQRRCMPARYWAYLPEMD